MSEYKTYYFTKFWKKHGIIKLAILENFFEGEFRNFDEDDTSVMFLAPPVSHIEAELIFMELKKEGAKDFLYEEKSNAVKYVEKKSKETKEHHTKQLASIERMLIDDPE